MAYQGNPVQAWSEDDVSNWLGSVGLGQLVAEFKSTGVDGGDLLQLKADDFAMLNCTPLQTKKIRAELSKLGIDIASDGMKPAYSSPSSPVASGYPSAYPAPPAYPPPQGMPGYAGSGNYNPYEAQIAELKKQQEAELMMKEMEMRTRLNALEMQAKNSNSSAPVVVSNNIQVGGGVEETVVYEPQTYTETYCGDASMCIAICCLFPCIAFCPIDERVVTVG